MYIIYIVSNPCVRVSNPKFTVDSTYFCLRLHVNIFINQGA